MSSWSIKLPQSEKRWDPWSLPAAGMWGVFFLAGLEPERLYFALRDLGNVSVLNAMVNSPHLITLAFSAYMGLFAYHRCLEAGLSRIDAKARALQFSVIGLVAFLNFPLGQLTRISEIPMQDLRVIVLVVAFAKILAWFFLLIVVMRYTLFGRAQAFAAMASLFPSTRRQDESSDQLGNASSVAWIDRPNENDAGSEEVLAEDVAGPREGK
jgi:hypothetical protein